jgi:hypothetical protein
LKQEFDTSFHLNRRPRNLGLPEFENLMAKGGTGRDRDFPENQLKPLYGRQDKLLGDWYKPSL